MHRTVWADDTSVEFHLPHGAWITLLRETDFEIERLVEIQAPADAVDSAKYTYVTADWARKWPSEEVWVAARTRRRPVGPPPGLVRGLEPSVAWLRARGLAPPPPWPRAERRVAARTRARAIRRSRSR